MSPILFILRLAVFAFMVLAGAEAVRSEGLTVRTVSVLLGCAFFTALLFGDVWPDWPAREKTTRREGDDGR